MLKNSSLVSGSIVCALISCGPRSRRPGMTTVVPSVTNEEREVFGAVMTDLATSHRVVALVDRTAPVIGCYPDAVGAIRPAASSDGRTLDLFDEFRAVNTVGLIPIGPIPEARVRIRAEDAVFCNVNAFADYWQRLHSQSSEGFVWLSRVGFDQEGKHALLYANLLIGPKDQETWLVLLESSSGTWKIVRKEPVAISE